MKQKVHSHLIFLSFLLFVFTLSKGGEYPKTIIAYKGSTPILDGVIGESEYDDAYSFSGVSDWFSDTHTPAQNPQDLSVIAWVKHDGNALYFAFDVSDDMVYGYDTERWVSDNNPDANVLNYQQGWSWWGDGVEIMLNATYQWNGNETCSGDGFNWQIVCSSHKSTLHGLEGGGLMAGEPRNADAWGHYETWTRQGDTETAVRIKSPEEGRGYCIEWRINPDPCMQRTISTFVDLSKETRVGLNIEITDLDEKAEGDGNWSNFRHIDYWAKLSGYSKTALKSWGTLLLTPELKSEVETDSDSQKTSFEWNTFPNPFNASTTITYELAVPSWISLSICDVRGRLVRTLFEGRQSAGLHRHVWYGNDSHGPCAGGIYMIKLSNGSALWVKKTLYIR